MIRIRKMYLHNIYEPCIWHICTAIDDFVLWAVTFSHFCAAKYAIEDIRFFFATSLLGPLKGKPIMPCSDELELIMNKKICAYI